MAVIYLLLLSLFCRHSLADPLWKYCNQNTKTSGGGDSVSTNIGHLLSQVVEKTERDSFATTSYGQGESRVYGLGQCRGDVNNSDCSSCIENAAKQIRLLCPIQTDARVRYEYCFLRYSKENFFGKLDTSIGLLYANVENVTDPDSFNKALGALFDRIDSKAIKLKNQGFGKGETKLSPFETLYGLVQCTRDLSPLACAQCLAIALENFVGFCSDKKGCQVIYSSCYVRYELYPFFFPLESQMSKTDNLQKLIH
ncbi:hypothetical protein Nepgr_022682 [Nepenthes gracilis]|uniref:Gnk2-homologous domain-containing protein n=1 Tax=Nepenthes gracilis TaxID=150966 RepID=A0AAD3SZZ8_NEPGR|nr:hypothetical protein Nepgr_022682 [Nepenthes gracilis]